MRRRTLAAVAVASVLVLAGCGGAGPVAGTPTTNTSDEPPTTTAPASGPDYDVLVFDSAGGGTSIIEGGLTFPEDASGERRFYATLLTDTGETDRFDWRRLSNDTARFVEETDFDSESLLVVEAFPKSSVPDYRVETVVRSGDTLQVSLNDSAAAGTADITLETVLLRVDHDGIPPDSVTVSPQDGISFTTGEGVRTIDPEPENVSGRDVTLPLTSDDESHNVAEPRDLRIDNRGDATNGYNVTVVGWLSPDCRDAEPACGQPDRRVVIFQKTGKLQPGESVTFEDLIARHGEYEITVEASLPGADGGRHTVTETYQWRISETYHSALVGIDDEGVGITQAVE